MKQPIDTIQILPPPLKKHCLNKKLSDCSFEELCIMWNLMLAVNDPDHDRAGQLLSYIKHNHKEELDKILYAVAEVLK